MIHKFGDGNTGSSSGNYYRNTIGSSFRKLRRFIAVDAVSFQGILERQMSGLPLIIEPGGIGSKKSKRSFTLGVFNQVEINPANKMDFRA